MQIIITGAAGFLGQQLAKKIALSNQFQYSELLLIDIIEPQKPIDDFRIICLKLDICDPNSVKNLINKSTKIVFHLAAIVSSHAEKDFDLGWQINVNSTHILLEACRKQNSNIRFVLASSCAVFGGNLPEIVDDMTALNPMGSYGSQKAICELMVNDYSRKGFIDGISLRLPTICIRPGKANLAASSFVSGIIREPLNGNFSICPVDKSLAVWISSPEIVINNFVYAAKMDTKSILGWRSINLPGIKITVEAMLAALQKIAGANILAFVKFEYDEAINKLVLSWPTEINNSTALKLGFEVDKNFESFILQYIENEGISLN